MDVQTKAKPMRCSSHSRYGRCGLTAGHEPGHAVFIGDDVWFIYGQPDRRVGYARRSGDAWDLLNLSTAR